MERVEIDVKSNILDSVAIRKVRQYTCGFIDGCVGFAGCHCWILLSHRLPVKRRCIQDCETPAGLCPPFIYIMLCTGVMCLASVSDSICVSLHVHSSNEISFLKFLEIGHSSMYTCTCI